jgi:hypothetical protein
MVGLKSWVTTGEITPFFAVCELNQRYYRTICTFTRLSDENEHSKTRKDGFEGVESRIWYNLYSYRGPSLQIPSQIRRRRIDLNRHLGALPINAHNGILRPHTFGRE